MNKKTLVSTVTVLLTLPALILAFNPGAIPGTNPNIDVNGLIDILFSILWPIAVAFFIVMFILAGFLFAAARGDADKIGEARQAVIWGVVGVVVALIAFSIVFVLRNVVGV